MRAVRGRLERRPTRRSPRLQSASQANGQLIHETRLERADAYAEELEADTMVISPRRDIFEGRAGLSIDVEFRLEGFSYECGPCL